MLDLPKRDRRAERRDATRAEIVDAAWEMCRAEGLAALSLRELANRVGMQAPSLYSYFASKNDIYDAMYAQGYQDFVDSRPNLDGTTQARAGFVKVAHHFVAFCTADPARYQLMFQRTIPGFEPSPESFAISVNALKDFTTWMASVGLDPSSIDLYTAILTGLTDQQISNDPGGDRWSRLIDETIEMFLNHIESKKTKGRRKR